MQFFGGLYANFEVWTLKKLKRRVLSKQYNIRILVLYLSFKLIIAKVSIMHSDVKIDLMNLFPYLTALKELCTKKQNNFLI